jgi:hypothetical protein
MFEQIIPWAALVLAALLCLPIAGLQKLILEVSAWGLRLGLLALLGAAGYLWFFPEQLPAEIASALGEFPRLKAILPEPTAPLFGMSVAIPVAIVLLPLLAVLDVARKLAGRPVRHLRVLTARPTAEKVETVAGPPAPPARPGIMVRRIDRRTAADAIVGAGVREPIGAGERLVR